LIENIQLKNIVKALRTAGKKGKTPIWIRAAELLERSRSARLEVNVSNLRRAVPDGALVVVPGKVLGEGDPPENITVGAYAFSREARRKIERAGGKTMSILEFHDKHKDGKGVLLIAG